MPQVNTIINLPPNLTYIVPANTHIVTGGTSQVLFASTKTGGYVTNPTTATELLYINPTGGTCTLTEGGAIFALQPGQTFTFGRTMQSPTCNAVTTGHVFSAVQF